MGKLHTELSVFCLECFIRARQSTKQQMLAYCPGYEKRIIGSVHTFDYGK